MATVSFSHNAQAATVGGLPLPGSPPDLTNSKSSKSSSLHSSGLTDCLRPADLSHFEDIDLHGVPPTEPTPVPIDTHPSCRIVSEASSDSHALIPLFRDLTSIVDPNQSSPHGYDAAKRNWHKLATPGKSSRQSQASPPVPSWTNFNLSATSRLSRSPSPSGALSTASAPRTLSRNSSCSLDASDSIVISTKGQSWQDAKRKTAKEREAEIDDEDDELPDDAIISNVPISPRVLKDRSPVPSTSADSPSQTLADSTSNEGLTSFADGSPASSLLQCLPRPLSSNSAGRGNFPSTDLVRHHSYIWQETYSTLDSDARRLTEALEDFQSDFERNKEAGHQHSGPTQSLCHQPVFQTKPSLPPMRKSDPLVDPFQPSAEKQKYLSRTRPSWLPPKDPKEEKKHLKEYQQILTRIEEVERLEAQRAREDAIARETAARMSVDYWSKILFPNWATEMNNPERRATHRKMWWIGIPSRLRGQIWQRAIGNDLGVTENTYAIALDKARQEIQQQGNRAYDERYANIVQSTNNVFPDLKMFASRGLQTGQEAQPLHHNLVEVCLAYSTYRPDLSSHNNGINHIAALLLLNLAPAQAFIALSNLLNRPLPLSFLVHDEHAIHVAYSTTLSALSRKFPHLTSRLKQLRVEPSEYLAQMFGSLFCERLTVDHAARVMDIYTVEGDKIPPRVAVAIAGILESSCLQGDAAQVAQNLREHSITLNTDDFIFRVYDAGKCI